MELSRYEVTVGISMMIPVLSLTVQSCNTGAYESKRMDYGVFLI